MIDPVWMLLDTHIWIWWLNQDARLPISIRRRIELGSESLCISSVSVYETLLLIRRGRLRIDMPEEEWLRQATVNADIRVLSVSAAIAERAALLPLLHGDPLDRLIIATALHHPALLVSLDGQFQHYPIPDTLRIH
ncbi:MAG: type II toxin-antitoxin system VapC family toxin [Magnetococcus sp. YQC-9]